MSHVVTIKVKMYDLSAIENAAIRLGGKLVRNVETYKWWGRHVGDYPMPKGFNKETLGTCHHKMVFPGCRYEVGVIEVAKLPADHPAHSVYAKNEFIVIYDFIDYSLSQVMGGATANKFSQAYACEKLKIEAKKKGYKYKEEKLANGKVKATIELS